MEELRYIIYNKYNNVSEDDDNDGDNLLYNMRNRDHNRMMNSKRDACKENRDHILCNKEGNKGRTFCEVSSEKRKKK